MKFDLSRLLRPNSVAVFGGNWAENVIQQCLKFSFEGEIWPVHPYKTEILGLECYEDVSHLPGPPDAGAGPVLPRPTRGLPTRSRA